MSPACLRGVMTAGPDVIRRPGPNHKPGLDTHDPKTGSPDLQFDRFASQHHHPRNSIIPSILLFGPAEPFFQPDRQFSTLLAAAAVKTGPLRAARRAWSLQCRAE